MPSPFFAFAASLPSPSFLPPHHRRSLRTIKTLVESTAGSRPTSALPPPIESLHRGNWVKLICGASFEDAVDVRNLSLVYTLAGVDCIDCAADASVVNAVNEGIDAAMSIAAVQRPWVMISVNDDKEDLHFRKAEFDPGDCPLDCARPCEVVCPANAISLERVTVGNELAGNANASGKLQVGVITERCYGCGRCFSICPYDKIRAITYVRDPSTTSKLLKRNDVDAIEIHTSGRCTDLFNELWNRLGDSIDHVKLVAVSMPDVGESTVAVMKMIYSIMESHLQCYNLWQLDGRPMSGDIGGGATREAIAFAVHLASTLDKPCGFYQLAGGTNSHTINHLKKVGLFQTTAISGHSSDISGAAQSTGFKEALIGGIAYGGYARKIVGRVLRKMPTQHGHPKIEDHPDHFLEALQEALTLVGPVKCYSMPFVLPKQMTSV
ncbi:hypothetical protein COCNU_01G001080 [Cocos nucifera]|uniref:4Fe-4S ferredoxin-type domain-containing protein n=1 Tax=Cocos nucifera TaxID=13894 RepID=A0A8K0HT85_COCNU|nr:hypothetical protein COCNU_01G001080 [Cocos nucifera]